MKVTGNQHGTDQTTVRKKNENGESCSGDENEEENLVLYPCIQRHSTPFPTGKQHQSSALAESVQDHYVN